MNYSNLHIKRWKSVILMLLISHLFLISNAQTEYKEVIAKSGDGIYILLRRYDLPPASYLKEFVELNKANLGKNNTLIAGKKYKLPVKTNSENQTGATYPIFGKKYETISPQSTNLKGAVYYLVGGHGGPDPGAIGKLNNKTLCEDEYAYDVTIRLAKNLLEHGATVYMITRDPNDGIRDESYLSPDKDEVCYPNLKIPLNQTKRLRQRKDAVNKLYLKHKGQYQRMIAIHVDARSKGDNIDVFFYYDKRSQPGKDCALVLQKTFQDKYNEFQPNRGYHGTVSPRNLYVLKYTYPVAVYIELGNINHHRDQQRFIPSDNRQALAKWLTEGLIKDYKK